MRGSGVVLAPSRPPYAAASIFRQDATKLARAADQTNAKKYANQLMYGVPVAKGGAFYGYEGMGYGGQAERQQAQLKFKSFNTPIWVVGPDVPRVPVWLVQEKPLVNGERQNEEELRTGIESLQAEMMKVPVPDVRLTHHGQLSAFGSDGWTIIWCPATDESWGFHRFGPQFASGTLQGQWKAGNGHYQANVSKWNGITAVGSGQEIATGLSLGAGTITHRDLVNLLRGGEIDHAIHMGLIVGQDGHVAPARLHDGSTTALSQKFLADGTTPNPAYTTKGPEKPGDAEGSWKEGFADAIPEGSWFVFPKDSRASDYGMTNVLEVGIYEALRKYGAPVSFRGGTCNINVADPMTLFTPYSGVAVNPFNGSSGFSSTSYINVGVSEEERAKWIDSSLPKLWDGSELNGVNGVLARFPWRTLELLEPRSS